MAGKTIDSTIAGQIGFSPAYNNYITVTDLGGITSSGEALSGTGTLVNDGFISGNSPQALVISTGVVTNQSGGRILDGGYDAVVLGGTPLTNSGVISGGANGIFLSGGASVVNLAGGTISGGAAGIYGSGAITNAGTIAAVGTAKDAVTFRHGLNDLLTVDPGAAFIGTVDGGNTIGAAVASTLIFAPGAGLGTFSGLGSRYVNFADISIVLGGGWYAAGNDTLAAGQKLAAAGALNVSGTLTNSGYISEGQGGFGVSQGRFVNEGTVASTQQPVSDRYGTIVNDGLISMIGRSAIVADIGGSITNGRQGLIKAGVPVQGPRPSYVVGVFGASSLTNAGNIESLQNNDAVSLNSGSLSNLAQATISSVSAGVTGYGVVLNAGTISGGTDAVAFGGNHANRLVVDPGALFLGTVDGGSALSALEFASGGSAGTFSGLDHQYLRFGSVTVDAGAAWTMAGANTLAAGYTLTDSGTLTLAGTLSNSGTLIDTGTLTLAGTLAGTGRLSLGAGGLLVLPGPTGVAETIVGLNQGTIEFVQDFESFVGYGARQLTLSGNVVLNLAGGYTPASFDVTHAGGNTFITACFDGGTEITTAEGPRTVETLNEGDRVLTATGRLAPVRWIGHRRTDLAKHPRPYDVMPVRIRAGAFGEGLPERDLVLSPDHAVFIDGRLIPIRHLINGASIVQETRESVTYWHVELDRHDVILAEGMACESYLDTGNRSAFENASGAVAMTPDFARAVWADEGCAPIVTDTADPALRALHTRLLARATREARDAA